MGKPNIVRTPSQAAAQDRRRAQECARKRQIHQDLAVRAQEAEAARRRRQARVGAAAKALKKQLRNNPFRYACSVDMGKAGDATGRGNVGSQGRVRQGSVATAEKGAQCSLLGCTQKAVQANVTAFSSAGTQTEAEFSEVQADVIRSGICCEGCENFCMHQSVAHRHWQDQHAARPVQKPNTGKFAEKHESIHSEEGPYACMFCPKHYHQEGDLAMHERLHIAKKPYSCGFCAKVFRRKDNLVVHVNKHAAWKLYTCKFCGKGYLRKGNLKVHERVHTDEAPYACRLCPDTFHRKCDLVVHEMAHRYSCKVCGEEYHLKSDLMIHERVHVVEKRYACTFCPKVYRRKWDLVNHERVHTGEKPFACRFCPHQFTRSSTLGRHEREAHLRELER